MLQIIRSRVLFLAVLKQVKDVLVVIMVNRLFSKNVWNFRKLIYYWFPVIFCAIFIFSISSIPGKNIPSIFSYQDIVFHLSVYAVFAFLIFRTLKAYNSVKTRFWRLVLVLGFIFVFALTDELHQSFVPNRTASLMDVLIDCIGAASGSFFYL